jgi:hypothetical protein
MNNGLLSQLNPIPITNAYFHKIHFNIISS